MSELARLKDGSPTDLTTIEMRAFEKAVGEVIDVLRHCHANSSRNTLIEALALLSDERLDILRRVLNAGHERADGRQIMREIAMLLGAFPASAAPDPKIYAEMMIDEITACSPSILALRRACSELRRTLDWPPSIADVMAALSRAESDLRSQSYDVKPDMIAHVTKQLQVKLGELDELDARLHAEIERLETELSGTLELEAEGYPVRPSSAELRLAIDRLEGKTLAAQDDMPA